MRTQNGKEWVLNKVLPGTVSVLVGGRTRFTTNIFHFHCGRLWGDPQTSEIFVALPIRDTVALFLRALRGKDLPVFYEIPLRGLHYKGLP